MKQPWVYSPALLVRKPFSIIAASALMHTKVSGVSFQAKRVSHLQTAIPKGKKQHQLEISRQRPVGLVGVRAP